MPSRRSLAPAALLLALALSALWPRFASGQVEEAYSFLERPQIVPALVQGADLQLYAVTDGGKRIPSSLGLDRPACGLLVSIGLDGATTVLHRFDGTFGAGPASLFTGQDGRIYGCTNGGVTASEPPFAAPTIFRVSTDGQVETVYTFSADTVPAELVISLDGTIYATTDQLGADGTLTGATRNPALLQITADGTATALGSYPGVRTLRMDGDGNLLFVSYLSTDTRIMRMAVDGSGAVQLHHYSGGQVVVNDLQVGADGNYYGTDITYNRAQPTEAFRLTPDGAYQGFLPSTKVFPKFLQGEIGSVLFLFGNRIYNLAADGTATLQSTLASEAGDFRVRNLDGSFYFVSTPTVTGLFPAAVPVASGPVLNKVGPDGSVELVTGDFTGEGSFPAGGLVNGQDGELYGSTFYGGQYTNGTLYRFSATDGVLAKVHDFTSNEGQNPTGALAVDAQGNLIGLYQPRLSAPGGVFRCSTSGQYARLHLFPAEKTQTAVHLTENVGRLAVGADGAVYGHHYSSRDGKLSVFRIAPDLRYTEPAVLGDQIPAGTPVAGLRGALYFGAHSAALHDRFFQLVSPGRLVPGPVVSSLTLPWGRAAWDGVGQFYGVGTDAVQQHLSVFRVNAANLALSRLQPVPPITEGMATLSQPEGLTRASDGFYYGLLTEQNGDRLTHRVYAVSAEGGYRALGDLTTSARPREANTTLARRGAALAEGPDGLLYGTSPYGGAWGGGIVFRTPLLSNPSAPAPADDVFSVNTSSAVTLPVLDNDSDPDGDVLLVTGVSKPLTGQAFVSADRKAVTYVAGPRLTGSDTFTYTVSDGFGMSTTATVTVNFPFFTSGGVYSGVVQGADGVPYALLAGTLDRITGKFVGRLTYLAASAYAKSRPLSGALFALDPQTLTGVTQTAGSGPLPELTGSFSLSATGMISVTMTEGGVQYTASLNHTAALAPAEAPAGLYTLTFAPQAPDTQSPDSSGFALVTVGRQGLVRAAGTLPDGTKFTLGGTLDIAGKFAFYLPLYARPQGYLTGVIDFTAAAAGLPLGQLRWVKPPPALPGTQLYPHGFDLQLEVAGAPFTAPARGLSALHQTGAPVNFLASATYLSQPLLNQPVSIDGNDRVTLVADDGSGLRLSINRSYGLFLGSFRSQTEGGVLRVFSGVILQPSATAVGLVRGAAGMGAVTLQQN